MFIKQPLDLSGSGKKHIIWILRMNWIFQGFVPPSTFHIIFVYCHPTHCFWGLVAWTRLKIKALYKCLLATVMKKPNQPPKLLNSLKYMCFSKRANTFKLPLFLQNRCGLSMISCSLRSLEYGVWHLCKWKALLMQRAGSLLYYKQYKKEFFSSKTIKI